MPPGKQISDLDIFLNSGLYGIIYYAILENTYDLILENSNIIERTYVESHINTMEQDSKNILFNNNVLKELKGGFNEPGIYYIIILYINSSGNTNIGYSLGAIKEHEPQPEPELELQPEPQTNLNRNWNWNRN